MMIITVLLGFAAARVARLNRDFTAEDLEPGSEVWVPDTTIYDIDCLSSCGHIYGGPKQAQTGALNAP
jgi:hypothetical protein